jgi:flagellar protein FlaJ
MPQTQQQSIPRERKWRAIGNFLGKISEKKKVENELYFVITYLYGVATSYCSLENMFNYVAQSEFKQCAKIFNRIGILAKKWHLGFINSLEAAAQAVKSKLLRDFLERFSQMLKTGDTYDRFLMIEHEAYVVAYEAEYDRSLKSMENLSNAYSAIITSVTFITITMTLTQTLLSSGTDANTVLTQLIMAVISTLFLSVFVLQIVAPVDRFVYLNKNLNIPKEFMKLKRFFPIALVLSIGIMALCVLLRLNIGWLLATSFIPMLLVGIVAKRADDSILRRENAFPTFIRTLGTTAGITGYSTGRTLKLLIVRDFGVLSTQIKSLYSKLAIGASADLCWSNLASECGSEMVRIFGGIYNATTFLGGDPSEIGKMISRNMIRMLVMRAKRIQIANGVKSMIYPLHAIECALLAFMTTLLGFLVKMISLGSLYTDIFKSSIDPATIAPLFTIVMILLAAANALAIQIVDIGNKYRFLYYLSVLMIITGGILVSVSLAVDALFAELFKFKLVEFKFIGGLI